MLERVFVVRDIIIVVVGIGEEAVAGRKHVGGADVRRWQEGFAWLVNGEYFLGVVIEVLA